MTALDPRALRDAFGSYMTGVTVVTTRAPSGEPFGFTANSFSSVSLDPPLLLVCPGKFLSSYDRFAVCRHFAVNVLSEGQEQVSNTFATFKGDRFGQVDHHDDAFGNPLIDGALARFSCSVEQRVDAGDHSILIGRVQSFSHEKGRGLGYAGGQYFSLGLERSALDHGPDATVCGVIIQQGDHVLLERTPEGLRPPQITLPDRAYLRQDLKAGFARRGLPLSLQSVYSIFDIDKTRFTYFLASGDVVPDGTIEPVAIDALANSRFCSAPVGQMMQRFALESRTRAFGLYLGDGERGDIHSSPDRN